MTDHYAVFGQPISHSKSPRIHQFFAAQTGQDLSYMAKEVAPGQFGDSVRAFFDEGGKGLNCTVPLKELAFAFADQTTARAQRAKAVNTLALQNDGSVLGDNTDGCGLVTDLTINHALTLAGTRILILGAGGAGRGIIGPLLEQAPKKLVIANRTVEKAVDLAKEFDSPIVNGCGFAGLKGQEFDIILNATSTSLSGQLPPLPEGVLAGQGVCYDLAYGNQPTAFVRWGWANNAVKSLDGLGMLVEQAAEAFFIWRGVRPQTQALIEELNTERGNIMNRELWLLRHGKAERDGLIADFQRSLKKSGKQAVRRIGLWLKQQGLKPDFLLTSPATRAFDTASIIVDTLDEGNFLLKQDDRLYFQGLDALKQILVELPPTFKRVLLVGHNPDFEDLFSYLAGAANLPATDKLLPTAALVRLKMPDDWSQLSPGCAQIISITYPKSLE